MIDEELYQMAADELNSERRRPHIWARACALANDDHDEARYLYTNLRVEELLVEATSGASDRPVAGPSLEGDLKLEPLEFEDLPEPDDGTASSVAAGRDNMTVPLPDAPSDPAEDGARRPESVLGHLTLEFDGDATLDLDPNDVRPAAERADAFAGEFADEPAGESADEPADDMLSPDDGHAASDDALPRDDDETGSDTGSPAPGGLDTGIEPANVSPAPPRDGLEELFASVAAAQERTADGHGDEPSADDRDNLAVRLAPSELDPDTRDVRHAADDRVIEVIEADEVGIDDTIALDSDRGKPADDDRPPALDDLDWLDEAYRAERQNLAKPVRGLSEPADGADQLTREFRRQADELPGSGPTEVIAHEPLDTLPTRRIGRDVEDDARVSSAPSATSGVGSVVPDGDDGPYVIAIDEPLELADDGVDDVEYAVFAAPSPGKRPQTVRQGGSWGALFATLPWLLYRRLIGTAIVYALLAIAVLAGLAVTGWAWYESGDATTIITKGATIGFALIAFVGLLVVPFRRANHWREDKLERRGFELVAYVRARRPERAIELVREAGDRLG